MFSNNYYPGTEQDWPFLPPKKWKKRDYMSWEPWWFHDSHYITPKFVSKWNPMWDSDNQYHTAVPKITNYHTNNYKLPKYMPPPKVIPKNMPPPKVIPKNMPPPKVMQLKSEVNSRPEIEVKINGIPPEIEAEIEAAINGKPSEIEGFYENGNKFILILVIGIAIWWFMTNNKNTKNMEIPTLS